MQYAVCFIKFHMIITFYSGSYPIFGVKRKATESLDTF